MSVTSISNAYINTHLLRWRGAYSEVCWTWSPGHRCQEVTHDFHGNTVETVHMAERPFLLPIDMEGLLWNKFNCTSLKDRKKPKNQWKLTWRLTPWTSGCQLRLCCCSYNEKIIQYKIPVTVLLTLQVGIRCKGRDERLPSYYRKRELTELWIYIKAPAPRNWYSKEMHFLGLFMSGTVSCNLLTNMVHGKNTHLEGLLFKNNFQLMNMENS